MTPHESLSYKALLQGGVADGMKVTTDNSLIWVTLNEGGRPELLRQKSLRISETDFIILMAAYKQWQRYELDWTVPVESGCSLFRYIAPSGPNHHRGAASFRFFPRHGRPAHIAAAAGWAARSAWKSGRAVPTSHTSVPRADHRRP